jgi:large subunit ribosomal protein L9
MQKVILQEDIEKLGHRGDVVDVKSGYARNFLLPKKLAIEATTGNMKALERIRVKLSKKTATEMDAAEKQSAALNGVELKFTRKTGENDQLFGSADALEAQGFKIDKRQVQLHDPLKALGEFPVKVKVFREISAELKITVAKEE